MKQKTIDDVLDNTRSTIILTGNIEADECICGISVAQIFGEIDTLAKTMSDDLLAVAGAEKNTVVYRDAKTLLNILRKLDKNARKIAAYNRIRPWLKNRFMHLHTARYADGRELLALDNSGLIIAVYQTVLGHEPDQAAIDKGLLFLTGAGVHKLDLIDAVLGLEEAKRRNVYLRGLAVKRFWLKLRRAFRGTASVNIRSILKYHNIDFVAILYRTALRREPEPEAIASGVKFLSQFGNHKVDLIAAVFGSEEAKRHNVRIRGLKIRVFLLRCKRRIYRIPVLGYMLRWLANVIMLPRRIHYIVDHIEQLKTSYELLSGSLSEAEAKQLANNACLSHLQDQMKEDGGRISQLRDQMKEDGGRISQLRDDYQDCKRSYEDSVKRITQLDSVQKTLEVEMSRIVSGMAEEKQKKAQMEAEQKTFFDHFYVNYNEKLLPDSRESIKQGVQIYLDKLNSLFCMSERSNVRIVDLGCGECEWVELLQEQQYDAVGVDNNSYVVSKVRETMPMVPIVEMGALEYLRSCADSSADVITSFHMVEHLELAEMMMLLKECHRVLKKDGILIVETPNPQNLLTATYYFYLDPTHKKPIPCELLAFIVQESGFARTETVFRNPLNFEPYEYRDEDPIKDIVFRFNLEQAYAIWAVKE